MTNISEESCGVLVHCGAAQIITEDRRALGWSCQAAKPHWKRKFCQGEGSLKLTCILVVTESSNYIYREAERPTSSDSGDRRPRCRDPAPSHCSCLLVTQISHNKYTRKENLQIQELKKAGCTLKV